MRRSVLRVSCGVGCFLALMVHPASTRSAGAQGGPVAGDCDTSGSVNAVDVQLVINSALGIQVDQIYHVDIDYSGSVNAVDVQLVINAALGISIDTDGDGLCDAEEGNLGSNPNRSDSDDDGLGDWEEVHVYETDPSSEDSDGDGTDDIDEPLVELGAAMQNFMDDGIDADEAADLFDLAFAAAVASDGSEEAIASMDRALVASINSIEDVYALWDRSNAVSVRVIEPGGAGKDDARTTVIFVNGVFNTFPDFELSLNALKESVGDIEDVKIVGVWNPAGSSSDQFNTFRDVLCPHLSIMLTSSCRPGIVRDVGLWLGYCAVDSDDLVDSALQLFGDPFQVQDPDDPVLVKIKDRITSEMAMENNVILIPHSQGNFYVRDAVNQLPGVYRDSLAIIQVASPSRTMPLPTVRVDVCGDPVPDLSGLPISCIPFEGRCDDSDPHAFVDSYLHGQALQRIREHIQDFIDGWKLEPDLSVDLNTIPLSESSPSAVVTVTNIGDGTLSWTATTNSPFIEVDPSSFTGNSKEVTITANDFSADFTAKVTFKNVDNESDFEEIDVPVTGWDFTIIPPEMRSVGAGSFEMGGQYHQFESNALRIHTVTLSAYEIGKYEITNEQYADILNWANKQGYLDVATAYGAAYEVFAYGREVMDIHDHTGTCQISYFEGRFVVEPVGNSSLLADHPVVMVPWYGAAAYCNWLSESQGLQPCYDTSTWECDFSKNGYHLPTEAQWERAAAGGGSTHYTFGNGSDTVSCASANFYDFEAEDPCNGRRMPVGYYNGENGTIDSPSPAGCYDMSGNVKEWCNDWWLREYTEDPVTNPTGPSLGSERITRGGHYHNGRFNLTTWNRTRLSPADNGSGEVGFRIAR